MGDGVLESLIGELKAAVNDSVSLATDERQHLLGLVGQVESRVTEEHGGLVDQIEDAVSRFETDHVALVGTLNRVANALSAGGI